MRSDAGPGPLLRLTALGAAAAIVLAVASGTFGGGPAHDVLAALALPPLVAVARGRVGRVPAARSRRRASRWRSSARRRSSRRTIPHVALASASLAATCVVAALTFRGDRRAAGRRRATT